MEEFVVNSTNKAGIFISKSKLILCLVIVLAVIIAEGLIIGLVGRPECTSNAVDEATKPPVTDKVTTTEKLVTDNVQTSTIVPENLPWSNIRLPMNLMPYEYELSLRPILKPDETGTYWFYGSSSVWYKCVEPTNYIILHSYKLEYEDDSFTLTKDGSNVNIKSHMFYDDNQFLVIETDQPCQKDKNYKLSFSDFKGELADDLDGLYRSEYDSATGEHVVIATTQMESTGARKTFPCFDEPALKANFTVTMWYEKDTGMFAVSNMPETKTLQQDFDSVTWVGQVFEETVPMSTYLLAMVICDFDYVESFTQDNVQTRIYARKEYVANNETDLAMQVSPDIIDYYEDYFNVIYPLPKSDQMGVPDFSAGAMENWGLVIYRESYILYDEELSSVFNRKRTVSVIAHELAHQWFGNLVSPAWWDDTWLNEGFATYVAYLGEAAVQPTWETFERFIVDDMQAALQVDSLTTSHPLVTQVNTPYEIQSQFDTISYNKGASVIRMTNQFLGESTFVNGLTNYLNEFAYGAATHGDLFAAWGDQAKADSIQLPVAMDTIMETWTLQMGYPLVNCRNFQGVWTVTQEYFLLDPTATPVNTEGSLKYNYQWYIPFTYKLSSEFGKETSHSLWLEPDSQETFSGSSYILGNIDAKGFYRVNYDEDNWLQLSAKLQSDEYEEISQGNRAQLMDDAFNLARAKQLSTTVALELTTYLSKELKYVPWKIFMGDITYLEYMLGRTPAYGDFEKYIQKLVKPSIYAEYAFNEPYKTDEYQVQRMTTNTAVHAACYYGDEDCIAQAIDLYVQWMADPDNTSIISTTYRDDVICTAIRNGGTEEWDFAWEKHQTSNNAQEQFSLRYGMSCSKDPWILNRYLQYCVDPTKIRRQDSMRAMRYVGGQEYGRDITWAFMVDNWDELVESYGSGSAFEDLILSITKRFSTEYDLHLLEDFKASTPNLGTAVRGVDQAIESTKINIAWREDNEDIVAQWLNDFVA